MAFKEDEDFARYLTMGAFATAAVSEDLERQGHRIIELERYAKANKIWATKVKRLRLADLLCLRCGRRFESKGKSKLALKMSHSPKHPRQWWAGMRPDDVFAFVRSQVTDDGADLGAVLYVTRKALHDAEPSLKEGVRKAIADGAEADVSWPVTVPTQGGRVVAVHEASIQVVKDDGRRQTYKGDRWAAYYPLRKVGERFKAGDALASSVKPAEVACAGDVWDWRADVRSSDTDIQFPGVKAARFLGPASVRSELRSIWQDSDVDWRLRLEAAASLAPVDSGAVQYMLDRALDATAKEGEQMEAIFALAEIDSDAAVKALVSVAETRHTVQTEVRAAAAWHLGLGAKPSPELLVPLLADEQDEVALHAAAAMPEVLPTQVVDRLLRWVTAGTLRQATAAAHLLTRRGHANDLLSAADQAGEGARRIALLAVGDTDPAHVADSLPSVDPTIVATLQTLWAQRDDWLRAPDIDGGLDVLAKQRVRL